MGYRTGQGFLGRTAFVIDQNVQRSHMVVETMSKETGNPTLCTVYPAPNRLISHF